MLNKMKQVVISTLLIFSSCFAENPDTIIFADLFDNISSKWNTISVKGEPKGSAEVENGSLLLNGNMFGIYNTQTVAGHFIVDLSFKEDKNIGLALIKSENGEPDINNYTMLTVDEVNGNVVVEVRDCQNGEENVLDYTGETDFDFEMDEEREELNIRGDLYKHVLTGDQYSVPFTGTNKTIRIFREDNADFFHYYYQVSKTYEEKEYIDWMEVRPSPDWTKPGTEFFVAIVSLHEGVSVIEEIKAVQKPEKDKDDRSTGFAVTKREYNWSGFIGDAYVITFDEQFPYHNDDVKFVFWTEMNYIPAWHLNNQLLYTYEFVETWDDNVPGCHEPMSDRMRQWAYVEVIEDSDVKKVLRWHYVLSNPNYRVPAEGKGEQLPEVDEYWTFYPDGTGTRRIVYTPKLDTDFRAPHELGEMISIAGSKSHSEDFYASPALSIMNLDGDIKQAHPGPKFDYYSEIDDWDQQILAVHFKDQPDVFCAWSTDSQIPETYSGYKIRYENAWQNPYGKIVHWPVNKRPYTSAFAAGGTWKGEVSHACLISFGVRDGIEWEDNYQLDDRERKYREWVSLVGLNEPGDRRRMINKTATWLFKGKIISVDESVRLIRKDYKENSFVLQPADGVNEISFQFVPEPKESSIINPVLRITNWEDQTSMKILVDNKEIGNKNFIVEFINGETILWIGKEFNFNNTIRIVTD